MLDRMFKKDDRDFWLYPKLLLVGVLGILLTAFLQQWMSDSYALGFALVPLFAAMSGADGPLSYRQWFIRIGVMTILIVGFETLSLMVKKLF